MKKCLVLGIIFFVLPLHAFVVEYLVFEKENAPKVHVLFDMHTADPKDKMYPMEKKHKEQLLSFLSNNKNNKVIVEDIEDLTDGKSPFYTDNFIMLDLLTRECHKRGISVVNVDCRALFATARDVAQTRFIYEADIKENKLSQRALKVMRNQLNKFNKYTIPLGHIHQEFKQNIAVIKNFNSNNSILKKYFKEKSDIMCKRFNQSLGLLKDKNKTLYKNIVMQFKKEQDRQKFMDKLDNLDNEFVDMRALYEIEKAQKESKKNVLVILGAFHSNNVSTILLQLGYKKIWSTSQLDFDMCNPNTLKAINLSKMLSKQHKSKNIGRMCYRLFAKCFCCKKYKR